MEDKVKFIDDVYTDDLKLIFKSGESYLILDEDHKNYYIQQVKNTNQVCKMPKMYENEKFVLVQY